MSITIGLAITSGAHPVYRGLDCDAFGFLSDAWYDDRLPVGVREVYRKAERRWSRAAFGPYLADFDDARTLYEHERRHNPDARLMAFHSPTLSASEPDLLADVPTGSKHLGFDLVTVGEWSLLRAIIDFCLLVGRQLPPGVEQGGLLSRPELGDGFAGLHRQLAVAGLVEPVAEDLPAEMLPTWLIREGVPRAVEAREELQPPTRWRCSRPEKLIHLLDEGRTDGIRQVMVADAPPQVWSAVLRLRPEFAPWVAHAAHLPDQIVRVIATWDDWSVRASIPHRPDLPADVAETLADDDAQEVRLVLATNPRASMSTVQKLVHDPSEVVAATAAETVSRME